MNCIVHNPQYRNLFHAVVNELRQEQRMASVALRTMPRQCCTCENNDDQTTMNILIDDADNLKNFKSLNDRIDQDKADNPNLVRSLNRLKDYIGKNRTSITATDAPLNNGDIYQRLSSSASVDDSKMEITKVKRKRKTKSVKPLKDGVFLYLPYVNNTKMQLTTSDIDMQRLQRGRFIGQKGYIATIGAGKNAHINMITSTTSNQIKKTLEKAKAGAGKVKIHNKDDLPKEENGEWIFIAPKSHKDKAKPVDFETLLSEIMDRWEWTMKIVKRKAPVDSDDDDEETNKRFRV